MKKIQRIIPFLPGYMFDGNRIVSTGIAIPASQHIHGITGEIIYYVRPLFSEGQKIGLFIRHQGILEWLESH